MRKHSGRLNVGFFGTLFLAAVVAGCDTVGGDLAPYEGSRPLIVQSLTRSYAPDVAWVGGRVAAIGINRGEQAGLDSSLVWLYTAEGNEIGSPVYVRDVLDRDAVEDFGGTPTDSLEQDETYTLWIAEREAYDAGLEGNPSDELSFADTTFTASYLLNGRSAGGVDVQFTVFRDQRLLSDEYTVTWSPASQGFRRLAIRNSSVGGFSDLLWHVVIPDSLQDSITPPLVIGQVPEDAIEAVEWEGFETGQHVLWAVTDEWDGESFGFSTSGYAFIALFASNFD